VSITSRGVEEYFAYAVMDCESSEHGVAVLTTGQSKTLGNWSLSVTIDEHGVLDPREDPLVREGRSQSLS
jgi:hypothetical protein